MPGGRPGDEQRSPEVSSADPVVYKICPRADWLRARQFGELMPSDDDVRDGFVHLSRKSQVAGTLARHFAGQGDLVLLAVRVERLPEAALRWEPSRGGQLFPHLYGDLPISAVGQHATVSVDAGGNVSLPEWVR